MRLYHGTNESAAQAILAGEGLLPRGVSAGTWHGASLADFVYLTSVFAPFFTDWACRRKAPVERRAILEIDSARLDEDRLYPDEHFIQKLIEQQYGEDWRAREDWSQIFQQIAMRTDWRASLGGLGTCAHRGLVLRAAITRVAFFSYGLNPDIHELLPEEVSIDVHAVGRREYQNLTRWFFKDALTVDDLNGAPSG